jgi:hypothetical protein
MWIYYRFRSWKVYTGIADEYISISSSITVNVSNDAKGDRINRLDGFLGYTETKTHI